jgi:1,4-alpha-glucan branching enzyme
MGATLIPGGATFRTWAPEARDVYVVTDVASTAAWKTWTPNPGERLFPLGDHTWAGFVPGIQEGDPYLFWIRGPSGGSEGFKRDPYARELAAIPFFPNGPCLARSPSTYPWHDHMWRRPAFRDFIIYQLHVGVFWAVDATGSDRRSNYGHFLDAVERIPYLRDLGVTAIQLLPIQEYDGDFGLGYAGLDYFSPEMMYPIEDAAEISRHLATVNRLLAVQGQPPLTLADLTPGPNQLKCLVDLFHLHGIAVIFDLVYNHAGGGFSDRSLYYYDRQPTGDDNRSLYFTNKGWAGGKVFAYWQDSVRQFLIDNAKFFLEEYRVDGIRYDEVTVIHEHGGDRFCRDLTSTVRSVRGPAIQIAEYWAWDRAFPVTPAPSGLGFDAALDDRLRDAVRSAVAQAASGRSANVDLDPVRRALYPPGGFPAAWRAVRCVENHDVVRWDYETHAPRAPRIPALADSTNSRSWYARSRSRVATGLILTAPGIPMLFMGQEFLEDKPWHDDVENWARFLIWWEGALGDDKAMVDHMRFTRELIALRRRHPALRGEGIHAYFVHNDDRVLAFHRWVEGVGRDVIVVASLAEETHWGYRLPFPVGGYWHEVFNSDAYDSLPPGGGYNPRAAGNLRGVTADGPGLADCPTSAWMVIPANGLVVLARDRGDG